MDAGGQLGREQSGGHSGPVGCSHARWADLVCDGEGKEAKGPGSSLGQETGEDIAGTRAAPTEPCFVTRARLRARGDLHRESGLGDFGVAAQCHPGHWKANRDRWHAQHGSAHCKH